jgi:hypothetical protein
VVAEPLDDGNAQALGGRNDAGIHTGALAAAIAGSPRAALNSLRARLKQASRGKYPQDLRSH